MTVVVDVYSMSGWCKAEETQNAWSQNKQLYSWAVFEFQSLHFGFVRLWSFPGFITIAIKFLIAKLELTAFYSRAIVKMRFCSLISHYRHSESNRIYLNYSPFWLIFSHLQWLGNSNWKITLSSSRTKYSLLFPNKSCNFFHSRLMTKTIDSTTCSITVLRDAKTKL